jgi:pimeloyl-ACP methyl ester carboxylesterase
MSTPLERRFDCWGQILAVLEKPGESVPVLCLHGWLDNAASFLPLMDQLANPMAALDFSGHGLSGHRPDQAATHYVDHVRDVLAVADQLGWDRFILMGHSMGAGVATLFAGCYPERVSRLVLIEGLGPPTSPASEVAVTLRRAIDEMQQLGSKQKPVYGHPEEAVEARTRGFGGLSHDCARLLCERGLMPVDGGHTWRADPRLRLTSSLRLTEEQVEGFARAIRAPTLLVVGEQGMGGQGQFANRLGWIEGLQLVRLEGRHHLHMESPAAVAAVIAAFLADDDK